MLADLPSKDNPLRKALVECILKVSKTSIPAYIDSGLATLRKDADAIRAERKQHGLDDGDQPE